MARFTAADRVLVGNTPLLALHILRRGLESGELQPGGMIIEATSGNTGNSVSGVWFDPTNPASMSAGYFSLGRTIGQSA